MVTVVRARRLFVRAGRRRWAVLLAVLLLTLAGRAPVQAATGRPIGVVLDTASERAKLLAQVALPTTVCTDLAQALTDDRYPVVVADATPSDLQWLTKHQDKLRAFTDRGGWLMLWGLTPAGLADFNRLVGVEHLLRPFMTEAVYLPKRHDPLLTGADPYDLLTWEGNGQIGIVLRSGKVWSYVLDGEDIAPFATIPPSEYWRPNEITGPNTDRYPPNIVNGLDDAWQTAFTIPIDKPSYLRWTFTFPRPEVVTQFSIVPEPALKKISRMRLSFPGSTAEPIEITMNPDRAIRQDFAIPSIQATGVTVELLDMLDPQGGATAIRNLWIKVQRSEEFKQKVHPLLSIGVLNKYPMGQGGIVVNQMNVRSEEHFANRHKQQMLLGVLLRNMLNPPAPAAPGVGQTSTRAKITGDVVNIDAFIDPDDPDDTEAIRRAIYYAIDHKLTRVAFSSGSYYTHSMIEVPWSGNISLEGALTGDGKSATRLVFLTASRFSSPPYVPASSFFMVNGAAAHHFVYVYSNYW